MAVGAQGTNSGLKAEAYHYMREARLMGKSLKNANAQRPNHSQMAATMYGKVEDYC